MQKTYICKYCGKLWESSNKRNGHQIRCKLNPNINEINHKIFKTCKDRKINSKPKQKIF